MLYFISKISKSSHQSTTTPREFDWNNFTWIPGIDIGWNSIHLSHCFRCQQCKESEMNTFDRFTISPQAKFCSWNVAVIKTPITYHICVRVCVCAYVCFYSPIPILLLNLLNFSFFSLQILRAASPALLRVIALGAFFIYCTVSKS